MKVFTVIVHYEGAMDYRIEAINKEEATNMAARKFEELNIGDLEGIDWYVCDSWEEDRTEEDD